MVKILHTIATKYGSMSNCVDENLSNSVGGIS